MTINQFVENQKALFDGFLKYAAEHPERDLMEQNNTSEDWLELFMIWEDPEVEEVR